MVALDITEAEKTMRESIVDDSVITWNKLQDTHMRDEHESIDETEFRNNDFERDNSEIVLLQNNHRYDGVRRSGISDLSDLRSQEVAKLFKIIEKPSEQERLNLERDIKQIS